MKFYIVQSPAGEIDGCYLTRSEALDQWHDGFPQTIQMVDVPVTAETVRRLLGQEGGYAKSSRQIWPTS